MSKQRKWVLITVLIGICMFIAFGEYKSWKEEQAFFQLDVGEGVSVELHDVNEYIQSEYYQFELPREISEQEAERINGKSFEDEPGDEVLAGSDALNKVPEFEKVFSEGTFYRIDERFTMTREELLQEWVRYFFSNPEDEDILQKEIGIQVIGFWRLQNEIFLQMNLEDPFGEEGIGEEREFEGLPSPFIGYTLQSEGYQLGSNLEKNLMVKRNEGTYEWILWGTLREIPLNLRYYSPDDTQHTISFFIDSISMQSSMQSSMRKEISPPISINMSHLLAGEEYEINHRISISPYHEIEFVRLINYSDHSAIEFVLYTEQEDDTLLYFKSFDEGEDPRMFLKYEMMYDDKLIRLKEKNRYVLLSERVDEEEHELTLNNLYIKVKNQRQFTVDVSGVFQGQRLLSYLGWELYADELIHTEMDLPPQLTLQFKYQDIGNKLSPTPSYGYHVGDQYEMKGKLWDSLDTEEAILFSRKIYEISPEMGEEKVLLHFRKFNGDRSSTPEFKELLQSEQLDYSLFRYSLHLPEFFIKYEAEDPISLPLTKTGKYFEPR